MAIVNAASGELDSILRKAMQSVPTTSGTYFDNTVADMAVRALLYTGEVIVPFGSAMSEFWYHETFYSASGGGSDTGSYFTFYSATGPELRLRADGDQASLRLSCAVEITTDGTSWSQLGSGFYFSTGRQMLDIHVKFGTGGFVRVYFNGRLRFEHSATLTSQTNACTYVSIGNPRTAADCGHSEMIVATSSTIGMRANTLRPTADGTEVDWTGDYTAIDDTSITRDDNDYIYTDSIGDVSTFVIENPSTTAALVSGRRFAALVVYGAAFLPPEATPGDFQSVVRSGGTTYTSADLGVSKDGGYAPLTYLWTTDPATGVAWTASGLNNAEIGVKAVA